MSCSYQLIVVIGYELVSYLLFYSSARCVTFKELFVLFFVIFLPDSHIFTDEAESENKSISLSIISW